MVSVAEEKEHEEEEEEEFEKLDLSDTLAPAVVMREVGNINDLPEELLLEIFLRLQTTTLLKVCYMSDNSIQLFLTYRMSPNVLIIFSRTRLLITSIKVI